MKVKFENRDHEVVAVKAVYGTTTHEFTLKSGSDPHEEDTGPNPTLRYAYKLRDDSISNIEFDDYSVVLNSDDTVVFGTPEGQVP